MNERELLAAVDRLTHRDPRTLECGEPGHPAGHACLSTSGGPRLSCLLDAVGERYGRPRPLVRRGRSAPTLSERTGLPLLAPFGERVTEMYAWAYGTWWIGCGIIAADDGMRLVVLVAHRAAPALEELARDATWVDRVVFVTGQDRELTHTVGWHTAEAWLGTGLPSDYKQLAQIFGCGSFDGYLDMFLPNGPQGSLDLVEHALSMASWDDDEDGNTLWAPHRLFPAPGGLLQWAGSEREDSFYWLTEGADPDRWPIMVTKDDYSGWIRFDGSTAEFIFRLLTDPRHPYSTARYFDAHWFMSYGQ
ncbi:hypothetical protein J7E87_28400 [Streptomyces sp. ISL-1]|uniref:hypothetical protein n=1 Tax=Streptomyces sp. ISL-1 TaxID=2817657 RepID=UPI001BEA7CDA|nr:hypothetical protein [Streptomyces sp. ISL-1]MBT2393244.1 hypothetical protein [Streptomyces sp. ISL-1]